MNGTGDFSEGSPNYWNNPAPTQAVARGWDPHSWCGAVRRSNLG